MLIKQSNIWNCGVMIMPLDAGKKKTGLPIFSWRQLQWFWTNTFLYTKLYTVSFDCNFPLQPSMKFDQFLW